MTNEVKKVEAFQTTDGKLWNLENVATHHQAELDLQAAIDEFVKRHGFSGMTSSDLKDVLLENASELRWIFSEHHAAILPYQERRTKP